MDRIVEATVSITDFSTDGMGIGRTDEGRVVKSAGCFPGDKVRLKVELSQKGLLQGELIEVLVPSADRCDHLCPHYQDGCPGSRLGAYGYDSGLEWKRKYLQETLRRIGGIDIEVPPVVPSPQHWEYRDRIELGVEIRKGVITFGYQSDSGLVPIKDCHLAMRPVRNTLASLNKAASKQTSIRASNTGVGRLALRSNHTGGTVAILYIDKMYSKQSPEFEGLLKNSDLTGWEIVVVDALPNIFRGARVVTQRGEPVVILSTATTSAPADPRMFTQVNQAAAKALVDRVTEVCRRYRKVLDLFGGYGMFGLELAARKVKVMVVELDKDALRLGRQLAEKEDLDIDFRRGNLYSVETWSKLPQDYNAVVVDPPHKGLDMTGISWLNQVGPKNLLYVSCHPAVLARDIKRLENYELIQVIPYDMFPQTTSLETLALFKKIT